MHEEYRTGLEEFKLGGLFVWATQRCELGERTIPMCMEKVIYRAANRAAFFPRWGFGHPSRAYHGQS